MLSLWYDVYFLVCFNFELCRLGKKCGEKSHEGILLNICLLYGVYLLVSLTGTSHVVLGRTCHLPDFHHITKLLCFDFQYLTSFVIPMIAHTTRLNHLKTANTLFRRCLKATGNKAIQWILNSGFMTELHIRITKYHE